MKNLKISQKLIVSFMVIIALFAASSSYNIYQLKQLSIMQDEGAKRGNDAVVIAEAAEMGNALYSVYADAIINRELEKNRKEWDEIKKETLWDLENVQKIVDTPEEERLIKEAKEVMNKFLATYDELLILIDKDTSRNMNAIVELDARADEYKKQAHDKLIAIQLSLQAEMEEADKIYDSKSQSIISISIVVSILVIIIAVMFIIILVRLIATPLIRGVAFANSIANGDLTASLQIKQKDEVGLLSIALNNMSARLKEVISTVIAGTNNIANASGQLSSTSQQISQGSTEQASSVEEVSSTMEEMVSNIEQNSNNAQLTEKISINAFNGIVEVGTRAKKAVEASKVIADKIQIINEIAFQTNILALNAAVEAARAGEHGKGFAVVAAEVRKLAERSKVAADEIVDLAQTSVQLAEGAGKRMVETQPEMEKTTSLVREIASASLEQNNGVNQINNALQQLNEITQQNAAGAEETASSAEELASQAEQLKEIVSFFKLNGKSNFHKSDNEPTIKHTNKVTAYKSAKGNGKSNDNGNGVVLDLTDNKKLDVEFEKY